MQQEYLYTILKEAEQFQQSRNFESSIAKCNELLVLVQDLTETESILKIRYEAMMLIALNKSNKGFNEEAIQELLTIIQDLEKGHFLALQSKAYKILGNLYFNRSFIQEAINSFHKAIELYERLGDNKGHILVLIDLSNSFIQISDLSNALIYLQKATELSEQLEDRQHKASIYNSFGNFYFILSDVDKSTEYFKKSLEIFKESDNLIRIAKVSSNLGSIHASLNKYDEAIEYYQRALKIYHALNDQTGIGLVLGNIGLIHYNQEKIEEAILYFQQSLELHQKANNEINIATILGNLGRVYANQKSNLYDFKMAETYLKQALDINSKFNKKSEQYFYCELLSSLYENEKQIDLAFRYYKQFIQLKDEVLNEETKVQAIQFEQRKQAAERDKEIEIAKATANAKLKATSMLLHRVLPESIANRMIEGEENISDFFPEASILFADIEGFTSISSKMQAIDVVAFLNFVFEAFDAIMKKYGCEKIKTIGDGYMAVAGVPIACDDHAERMAAAALEMQETIFLPDEIRNTLPIGSKFGIRIGIHIGPVVAGVIGKERFVYDIHSDAVNLASRMESTGQVDKVHISEDFADHLQYRMKQNPTVQFNIQPRGEMEVKGKGVMKTFFLDK